MGGHSLLALLLLLILESWRMSLACLPREYKNNNICCPMCDKGSFVKSHCQSESSSSVCVICADTTFMDHPNGLTECRRCSDCDSMADLIVKEKCTTTSDTVCECRGGHFCEEQGCMSCEQHTQCKPGQYVKISGTPLTNAVCEECPEHHFSNETNANNCHPWKECSELNLDLSKIGTSTNDSVCVKRPRIRYVPAFAVLAVSLSIIPGILYFKKLNSKQEMNQVLDPNTCSVPFPKQEEGLTAAASADIQRTGT